MKKNEKLLDVIGEVDDKHIPDSKDNKKKNRAIGWISAVAGVGAAAAIGLFVMNFANPAEIPTPPDVSDTSVSVTTDAPVTLPSGGGEAPITFDRSKKETVVTGITANSVGSGGVMTNSSFTVKTSEDLSAGELSEKLMVTPAADFTVEKSAECEYTLSFGLAMDKGSVVKIAAASDEGGTGDCWAFQIIDDFRITDYYPADGSDSVNIDAGVEIMFSESVDLESAKEHFSISPEVNGELKTQGNMLYFTPYKSFKDQTKYRVTVTEGLKANSGNVLSEGLSFTFGVTDMNNWPRFYVYGGISETFIAGDPVVIELRGLQSLHSHVELYQYGSADDYMSDLAYYADNNDIALDKDKVTGIYESDDDAIPGSEGAWKSYFVMLPDELDEGWYVAKATVDGHTKYHFFEMNPISVYSASLGDKTLFYVNDTDTGKPAVGAEVTLHTAEGDFAVKTDSKGLAQIDTGFNTYRSDMLEITSGDHRYIDSLTNYQVYKRTYSDMYFTYLYTDREAYQTSDTVNIWGVISPRRDGVTLPEKLVIGLGSLDGETPTDGIREEVKLSPDGTFTASLSYKDRESGWWSTHIFLLDGDNDNALIRSKYLTVMDYVKPTYTFSADYPEYVIMPHKDPFNVTINAEYFDGTPAEKLEFSPENGIKVKEGSKVTDKEGAASMTVLAENSSDQWRPWRMYSGFRLVGIENTYQYVSARPCAFSRDVMVEGKYDDDAKTYTINTNKIDFSKIPDYLSRSSELDYYDKLSREYDVLRGDAYDCDVKVTIRRSWTEREETGTYYDFLEKRTRKTYNYNFKDETFATYNVRTVNGTVVIDGLDLSALEGSYHIEITCKDTLGQSITEHNYFHSSELRWTEVDYRDFYLDHQNTFEEGEDVSFALRELYYVGGHEGNILFIAHQNDFLDAVVYDSAKFTYKADNSCTPNFSVCGAYFDGRHVYPINGSSLSFKPDKREIFFDVTTDKEKYDAGEEVTLTVFARDGQGRAVTDAPVSLSVVDEAAFAVKNQYANILDSFYAYVNYPYANQKCSYVQHVINGLPGTEMGGGGDDEGIRRDFRDNPYFGEGRTDSGGKAVFKFKLADSITKWRATIQSFSTIGGRMYAGSGTHPIIATRPVFITPIMLTQYVVGDDVAVTAKCVGLGDGDLISVTVAGEGKEITREIESCKTANFGKLDKGDYTVTFRADNGENSDAIEMPITVLGSKQEVKVGKDMDLGELSSISPTKWPVRISFFDKEYLFCHEILNKLSFYGGDRYDMSIAGEFAANELGWLESDYSGSIASATAAGLAKNLRNGNEDLEMTALLCAAFPESVSKDAVERAFTQKMKGCTLKELSYCYMGLAAIGRPVLEDIKSVLEEYDSKLEWHDKMILTAGLALGGDFAAAYDSYIALTDEMSFYSDTNGKPCASLENQTRTKFALLIASVLDLPEAEPLARGLTKTVPQYDSYALELVAYIRNYVPATTGKAAFSYETGSGRETVELDRYGRFTASFDKEHFDKADFRAENGEVLVYACYTGKMSEIEQPKKLRVTKRTVTDTYKLGYKITVEIETEPNSVVEDVIPSCARLYSGAIDLGSQRVRLYTGLTGTASYTMILNTAGEYKLEGAYACKYDTSGFRWGASEPAAITVTE